MLRVLLLLSVLFTSRPAAAQTDTLLKIYPNSNDWNTTTSEHICLVNGNVCVLQRSKKNMTALLIDPGGVLIQQLLLDSIADHQLGLTTAVFELDNELVFISNSTKSDKNYALAISTEKDLSSPVLLDFVELIDDTELLFEMFKRNPIKPVFEGFGIMQDPSGNFIQAGYLSFDYIDKRLVLEHVQGISWLTYILDFVYEPVNKIYVLSMFAGPFSYLVDENFILIKQQNLHYEFMFQNSPYGGGHRPETFRLLPNGNILCLSKFLDYATPYWISISEFTLNPSDDTIQTLYLKPLNEPKTQIGLSPFILLVDSEQNSIVAGSSSIEIELLKLNQDHERIWSFKLSRAGEKYELWDAEVDANDDIVVTGLVKNWPGAPAQTGFLLKITADGKFGVSSVDPTDGASDTKVVVYPNPSRDAIFFEVDKPNIYTERTIRLFDMKGSILAEKTSSLSSFSFDISTLPSAAYTWTITAKGLTIRSGIFIKQ